MVAGRAAAARGGRRLEDWLYDLSTLYLDSCSAFKADQEELSACGMDGASLLTVSLTSGETFTLPSAARPRMAATSTPPWRHPPPAATSSSSQPIRPGPVGSEL